MSPQHDEERFSDELQEVADVLRDRRPALEPLELDAVKLRATSGAGGSTSPRKRSFMRSRLTTLLTVGFLAVGTGGAFALYGGGHSSNVDSASHFQYRTCDDDNPVPGTQDKESEQGACHECKQGDRGNPAPGKSNDDNQGDCKENGEGDEGKGGNVRITTSGGGGPNHLNFTFANLLPGEPQTAAVSYQNTGKSAEDVWVVFDNAEALHALNNLGTFGEVTIKNASGTVFHSTNLNDNQPPASGKCGKVLYSTNEFSASGCWPLKAKYKLGSHIAPTGGGWMQFSFGYASKLKDPKAEEQPFNTYPPEVKPALIKGNGLPYKIVATQVGQEP